MLLRGTAVVCTFDVAGTTLAAVWDGGPDVCVHVVENGAPGVCVDRWTLAPDGGACTLPECTPAVLEQIVRARVDDDELVADVADLAAAYLRHHGHHEHRHRLPKFSAN